MNDLYVLDACALVALIKGEQGADFVWNALNKTATGDAVTLMHEVNLLEVYYGFYRERGKDYYLSLTRLFLRKRLFPAVLF